tara:strand:- start:1468 stop:1581 length:114 start_codon:yes stop_codon:yes gene_type:complete
MPSLTTTQRHVSLTRKAGVAKAKRAKKKRANKKKKGR